MKRKSVLMIGTCLMLVMAACGADTSKDNGTTPTNAPVSGEETPAAEPTKAEVPETTTAPTEVPSQEPTTTTAPAETEVYGAVELFNQCGVPLPEGDIVEKRDDRLSVYGNFDYEDFINYVNVLTAAGYNAEEIPEKTEYNSENYECEMYNAWGGKVSIKFLYRTNEPSELRVTLDPVEPPEVYGAEALFNEYEVPLPAGYIKEESDSNLLVNGDFTYDDFMAYLDALAIAGYSVRSDISQQGDDRTTLYDISVSTDWGSHIFVRYVEQKDSQDIFDLYLSPVAAPVTPTPSPSPSLTPVPVQYKVSDFGLPEPDFSYWFVEVTYGNEVVSGIEETTDPNAEPLLLPQYVFKSAADPEAVFKYMQLLYDEGWGDYRHERFGTESSFWHTGRKGDYYVYVGWSQSTGETDIIITDHGNPIVESSEAQPESAVTSTPSFNTDWASNEFEMLIPQPPIGESDWKTEQKDDDTYRITTYGPNLNVTVFMDYVNLLSSYGFTIEESMAEYIYIATDANGNEVKLLREADIHQYTIIKVK